MVRFEPLEVALGQELLLIELLALTHDDVIVQVQTTTPPQPAVLLQVPPEELPHPAFTNAARQPMIEANVEMRIAPSSTKLRSDAIILPARPLFRSTLADPPWGLWREGAWRWSWRSCSSPCPVAEQAGRRSNRSWRPGTCSSDATTSGSPAMAGHRSRCPTT